MSAFSTDEELILKRLIVNILKDLTEKESRALACLYGIDVSISDGIELAQELIKNDCIRNCKKDPNLLKENLGSIECADQQKKVDEYIHQKDPPPELPGRAISSSFEETDESPNDSLVGQGLRQG